MFKDHLSSVRETTNSSGQLTGRYDYDPFGRRTIANGDNIATSFAGMQEESHSLLLATYRAYDARLGRWLSEDPLGLADGPNLFAYVENAPLNRRDPLGLAGISAGDIAGLIPGACEVTALSALLGPYNKMKQAKTIDADKYFHCVGSCESARVGYCGFYVSYIITEGREIFDYYFKGDSKESCAEDREANRYGRRWKIMTCRAMCIKFRPPKMDERWW
jgi:RHS repeat-associated protein